MRVEQTRDFKGQVNGPVTLLHLEPGDEVTVAATQTYTHVRRAVVVMWEEEARADEPRGTGEEGGADPV